MDYKPSDIFVGALDLFAVMMPGGLLSVFGAGMARNFVFNDQILPNLHGGAETWVAFVFASYLLGHFIFLLGSHLDRLYDATYRKFKSRHGNPLLDYAKEIKRRHLGEKNVGITNMFKWARANVQLQNPNAAAEIDRLEADSKFFRSLIIVLLIIGIILGFRSEWLPSITCLVLVLLSFWRYFEQRWKFTSLTYEYFIALEKLQKH